jgi:uncharacterized protein
MQHTVSPTNSRLALERAPGLTLIDDTPKGRGVFASQPIPARTVIEVCPVLILDPAEVKEHIGHTILHHYTYNWPWRDGSSTQAIILGLGSMFNHSTYGQNVAWTRDVANKCIVYTTLRDIKVGEELCISYGNGRLWFKDAEMTESTDQDGESGLENIELV